MRKLSKREIEFKNKLLDKSVKIFSNDIILGKVYLKQKGFTQKAGFYRI